MVAAARDIHLFLTHFHLDHVCGLAYVPGIFAGHSAHRPRPRDRDHRRRSPNWRSAELIRPPYNPRAWAEIDSVKLSVAPLEPGRQPRRRPRRAACASSSTRRPRSPIASTTASCSPPTRPTTCRRPRFARGVEVLLHEAWIDGVEEGDPDKAQAGARRLRRPHLGPAGRRSGLQGRRRRTHPHAPQPVLRRGLLPADGDVGARHLRPHVRCIPTSTSAS